MCSAARYFAAATKACRMFQYRTLGSPAPREGAWLIRHPAMVDGNGKASQGEGQSSRESNRSYPPVRGEPDPLAHPPQAPQLSPSRFPWRTPVWQRRLMLLGMRPRPTPKEGLSIGPGTLYEVSKQVQKFFPFSNSVSQELSGHATQQVREEIDRGRGESHAF